jgi:hypothetical protein
MDYDEPLLVSNEKIWPIQWIERPIGGLVAVGSLGQFIQIWLHVK